MSLTLSDSELLASGPQPVGSWIAVAAAVSAVGAACVAAAVSLSVLPAGVYLVDLCASCSVAQASMANRRRDGRGSFAGAFRDRSHNRLGHWLRLEHTKHWFT